MEDDTVRAVPQQAAPQVKGEVPVLDRKRMLRTGALLAGGMLGCFLIGWGMIGPWMTPVQTALDASAQVSNASQRAAQAPEPVAASRSARGTEPKNTHTPTSPSGERTQGREDRGSQGVESQAEPILEPETSGERTKPATRRTLDDSDARRIDRSANEKKRWEREDKDWEENQKEDEKAREREDKQRERAVEREKKRAEREHEHEKKIWESEREGDKNKKKDKGDD